MQNSSVSRTLFTFMWVTKKKKVRLKNCDENIEETQTKKRWWTKAEKKRHWR